MIKLTLYCDKCDKEWDRKEGVLDIGNFHVTCKECVEAEKVEHGEVTPEAKEETV
jgi:predicted  nucleic acid-binding Zn ribbon protein